MLKHHFATTYTPSQITALIATHHPDWQVCFLNNAHRPVIGICPKVAWTATFDKNLYIHKKTRQVHGAKRANEQRYPSTYDNWQHELMAYADQMNLDDYHHGLTHRSYVHGFMGFIGYDLSAHQLNHQIAIKPNQPCGYLAHYDIYLQPIKGGYDLIGMGVCSEFFQRITHQLSGLLCRCLPTASPIDFQPIWTKAKYAKAFYQTQEYLKAGDTYQINLTQKWHAHLDRLANHLPDLQDTMNAPFAGFLQLGEFELLSISPELFFEFQKTNGKIHLITKPIKGTRPRHADPMIDDELKQSLANSEKDISENLMIVDLLRNDLGKYAQIGTVKTPKRFAIESFKNVHHMVSTVTATLSDTHPITVLFGSLPAGSITGAPKKRACEIIHELETSPRGAYCGTMGYLNFDGTGSWNVLIRTLQKWQECEIWAGGGITIKSNVDDEYQECQDKIGTILAKISQPK